MTLRGDWASVLLQIINCREYLYQNFLNNVPLMPVYRLVLPWVSAKKGPYRGG